MRKFKAVEVYTYAELLKGSRARERATATLQEQVTDHGWWYCTYDEWKPMLELIGIREPKLSFSGFWSQGDGASFTSTGMDLERLIDFLTLPTSPDYWKDYRWTFAELREKANVPDPSTCQKYRRLLWVQNNLSLRFVRRSHHYSHENTCTTDHDFRDGGRPRPKTGALIVDFCKTVEALRCSLCRLLYRDLEDTYEGFVAEDYLADFAEANDYLFTASGNVFCGVSPPGVSVLRDDETAFLCRHLRSVKLAGGFTGDERLLVDAMLLRLEATISPPVAS